MKNHSNIYVQISEFPKKRVTSGKIVFTNREKPDCMNSHAPD